MWLAYDLSSRIWLMDEEAEWPFGFGPANPDEGDWTLPVFNENEWINITRDYSYNYAFGCACFNLNIDHEFSYVMSSKKAWVLPVDTCKRRPLLKKPEDWGGWIVWISSSAEHKGAAISYRETHAGKRTFSAALDELKISGHSEFLHTIRLSQILRSQKFQEQILTALNHLAPVVHSEAMHSSGNMHNPKMLALHKYFDRAVTKAELVQSIERELHTINMSITGIEHEKLELIGPKDQRRFRGGLLLIVESL